MAKLLPWKNALLGLEATGGSPMDGEGDVGDGEDAGVGAEGGEEVGAIGGGVAVEAVGAGEGAWPVDIVMRARDMASMSMARVSAMASSSTEGAKAERE
ncbi:hypothetical protein SESBI_18375 [Sesbania bispinosa]|nr:hypothetical protein SESBI_18375 [Sesbania bispinosa]